MAVLTAVLSDTQRRTLQAVCDTVVPAVQRDEESEVMREYLERCASDLGVPEQIEGLMAQAMAPEQLQGFADLLEGLAQHDFANLPLEVRTQILHDVAASSHEARLGVMALRNLTFLFFYGLPDEQGRNPNWEAIGYPGPISAPPSPEEAPKTITALDVEGDEQTLTVDACVVGSGAGGAVIAAELQKAGKSVLVLEMGGYRNEADFKQLELLGLLELYLGGGLIGSEDGSISIFAGSTLGGGTVVNYMNCLRTPERIRREWAEHGIDGIDQPDYDRHIDAVMERISATDEATTQNRQHKKLIKALDEVGIAHRPIVRNVDPSCDDPRVCGYCFAGCQKGCKQSTLKTFLQDASDAGAAVIVGCHADRILVDEGRARGVEATVTQADGSRTKLTVDAADGGRRLRLDRVARAPAAIGDRRSGGRQAPAPAPGVDRERDLRGADRGVDRADPVRGLGSLRRLRGRVRFPDRVRRRAAGGARLRDPVARRRAPQARVRADVRPSRAIPVGRARPRRG